MSYDYLQESLQTPSPLFDYCIVEAIQVNLAGKRWDGHACGLSLEQIAEDFEVRVSATHLAATKLEGGDVG